MHYMTIVMDLIDEQPELAVHLRRKKHVLATIRTYAAVLKTRHEAWQDELSHQKPGSHPSQITSEALELAIEEIRGRLRSASKTDDGEALSLDAAMRFIRQSSPTA